MTTSNAWETTPEDVDHVLRAHGLTLKPDAVDSAHDLLDHDAIEEAVLAYTDFDDQVQAAFAEIEEQLMCDEVIPIGERKFESP